MALSAKDLLKKLKENTLDKTTLDERIGGVVRRNTLLGNIGSMAYRAVNTPRPDVSGFAPQYNKLRSTLQQPAGRVGQSIINASNALINSPLGAPGRVVMGKSNSAPGRWIQGYQSSVRDNVLKAGQSFDKNFSQIDQGQSFTQRLPTIASGVWNTAKALSQVTPKGVATMAVPSVIGGGVALAQKQDPFIGAGRSGAEFQSWRPVLRITDPLTAKTAQKAMLAVSGRGASRLAKIPIKQLAVQQLAQRGVTGIGNTIEDEILARLDGLKPTTGQRASSFLIGGAMGGNSQLLDQAKLRFTKKDFEQVAKQVGKTAKEVEKVYTDSLARRVTITDNTGKSRSVITDKAGSGDWIAWASNNGYKYDVELTNGSLGSVGGGQKPPTDPTEALKVEARKAVAEGKSAEEFVASVHKQIEDPANGKSFTALAQEYGLPTNEQKILNDVEALRWSKDGPKTYPEAANQLGVGQQYKDITAKISKESDARYKNPYGNVGMLNETYTRQKLTDLYNQAKGVTQAKPGKVSLKPKIQTEKPAIAPGVVNTQQPSLSQGTQKVKLNQPQTKVAVQQPGVENKKALDDIIAEGRKSIGATNGNKDKKSVRQVLSEAYTQWVDRYNPLTQASRQAKKALKVKGAELRPEYDPEYLVRRLTGAGGIADYRFNTELKPTIDAIDQAGIPKLDMDTYLAHKRMAGFGDVGREVYGTDPAKSRQITRALEAKYPEISRLADQLYRYQDQGLQELANAGFLSKEAVDAMRSQNPDYSPLYRVMDEMNDYLGLPTRKTMQGSNPVVRIKGSTKQIDSPLENIIGNTFSQRAAIEKNRVAQSIVGLQDITDMGFEKVAKSGNDTITVWRDGNKEYWRVGSDIADTAKGLNEENMNMVLKILQAPASLLRQGATGRNPDFMLPNIIRDQLDAGITSKYGYIPFVDYVSGLKSMLKNDEYYQRWANSGAKIDLGELSGRKSIQQLFDEKKTKRGLFGWLSAGLDVMGKYSEQPTRVGLFKKAYRKTGNELLAAMESRDATVDFARMGSKMKVANSIIPFLNVGVQGFDKLARSIKNQPGKVAFNLGVYAALPAITTTLWNLTNHGEEYSQIPQYVKDTNFVLVTGTNKNGEVEYIEIPKGNVVPIVANPVTSFLEYLGGANQQTLGQLATQLLSETLPVVEGGQSLKEVAVKTIGSNLPQAMKPLTENLMNKSFFKYDNKTNETKEIVPYYLKDKPAYEQAYEFTPEMYKKVGALLNVSPLQVQNLAEGYLAGFAKIPANIIDIMVDISKGKQVDSNQIPVARRFFQHTYQSSKSAPKETIKAPSMMERLTGKADASTQDSMAIPEDQATFNELYNEASKKAKSIEEKRMIEYDPTLSESEKQAKLAKLQERSVAWAQVLAEMENGHPEKVFEAQLDTYKTGSGRTVEERGEWVYKKLETAKDEKELQSLINRMWEEKVLTTGSSGVAQYLEDTYGIKLKYTGTNKKIKVSSGKSKKIKLGSTPQMNTPTIKFSTPQFNPISMSIPKINIQMPKSNRVKIKPSIDLRKVKFV